MPVRLSGSQSRPGILVRARPPVQAAGHGALLDIRYDWTYRPSARDRFNCIAATRERRVYELASSRLANAGGRGISITVHKVRGPTVMVSEFSDYCKAYELRELRRFAQWTDGFVKGPVSSELADDTIVFVHPDYNVTSTIFAAADGSAQPGEAWIAFCKNELGFQVPPDLRRRSPTDTEDLT